MKPIDLNNAKPRVVNLDWRIGAAYRAGGMKMVELIEKYGWPAGDDEAAGEHLRRLYALLDEESEGYLV